MKKTEFCHRTKTFTQGRGFTEVLRVNPLFGLEKGSPRKSYISSAVQSLLAYFDFYGIVEKI